MLPIRHSCVSPDLNDILGSSRPLTSSAVGCGGEIPSPSVTTASPFVCRLRIAS
jgi:hypothetical protein